VHAAQLGASHASLVASGMFWAVYRQRVVMREYPGIGDDVRITTWPGVLHGPIFPRYFTFARPDGTPLGEAVTACILMDVVTRRPLRPNVLSREIPLNTVREAPLPLPGPLSMEGALPHSARVVRYSDLDLNGHMNNARYADWVCDALDLPTLCARGLRECQINYIAEARPEETLSLLSRDDGESTLILGKKDDGRTAFEARVVAW
jgi:acyl-ACP thioesterase